MDKNTPFPIKFHLDRENAKENRRLSFPYYNDHYERSQALFFPVLRLYQNP